MDTKSKEEQFKMKVASVNRCTKVVKGGRRFSFSAVVVLGNYVGCGSFGFAKARSLPDSIKKAEQDAKKRMITAPMKDGTVPMDERAKADGVRILVKPAKPGTGLVAGKYIKRFLQLLGYEDVVVKNFGGRNVLNQIRATYDALLGIHRGEKVVALRETERKQAFQKFLESKQV